MLRTVLCSIVKVMATSEIVVPHPTAEAEEIYRRWIRFLDEEFLKHCSEDRRSEIVRDQLTQIYLGRDRKSVV